MGNVTIWNGVNAKNLATDYSFSSPTFDGMLVGNQLTHNASTGITSGGVLSINADTTKFNLTAGTGNIVDYSTPTNPSIVKVSWNAFTAQTVTGLAVQDETYILIDSAGAITQLSNFPTPTERRAKIFVGRVGHSTRVLISFATSFPDYGQSVGSQMFDLYDALGPFNISGNQISNNGANLGFQKSAGSLFFRSFNYPSSPQAPHVSTIASAALVSFFYRDRDSVFTPAVTVIDPTTYDVAGVLTTVPNPGATATIQRVYVSPNGTMQVQYGQTLYTNLTAAIAAIGTDPFIQNPALTNTSVLIGYIVVQKNCLALNDTATSAILRAPKFETGVGGGVNSVVSLQQTYNSSTQPQIVLTSGQGGVQVYDNATPIGADLFTVANNGGGTKYLDVTSAGITTSGTAGVTGTLTAGQVIDSGLTASRAVYGNASKQLTSSATTDTQLGYLSTTTSDVQTQIDRKAPSRNYIQDPLFTQGTTAFWSLGTTGTLTNGIPTGTPTFGSGANANLTIASVSSGQLEGTNSLRYQHITNQTVAGNMMASSAIALDIADQARVLGVKFAYKASVNPENGNFSGTSSNSFGWAVYDVTNSAWIGTAGQFNIVQSSGVGYCTGTLQIPSNTTSIRFVFYNVTATSATTGGGAITMLLDDFFLGPQVTSIAPAMSDWTSYTPTLTNMGNATPTGKYRRVGDSVQVMVQVLIGSTAPTGTLLVSMPPGLSADSSKIVASALIGGVGSAYRVSNNTGATDIGAVKIDPGTNLFSFWGDDSLATWNATTPVTWALANADALVFDAQVPVVGFSSNVISSADTDTRVVAFRASNAAATSFTNGGTVTVPFATVGYDTHGGWNGSDTYTVGVTGFYKITAKVSANAVASTVNGFFNLNVAIDGTTTTALIGGSVYETTASTYKVADGETTLSLRAGQTIKITVLNGSGTTTAANAQATENWIAIERLSGPAVVQASESVNMSYSNTAGTTVGTTATDIPFATKYFDSHSAFGGTSYVCPTSGKFRVSASLLFGGTWAATTHSQISAIQAGSSSVTKFGTLLPGTGAASNFGHVFTGTFNCLAGDTLKIQATAGVSSTLNTTAGANHISIERIGN